MDRERSERSVDAQWGSDYKLPYAVGIMADDDDADTLTADLGLSTRWDELNLWPLPSESSVAARRAMHDNDWSTDLDDVQGNIKGGTQWADEYLWNLPAESSVFDRDSPTDSERASLTNKSSKRGNSYRSDDDEEEATPGAYEVNERAPGSIPAFFRRAAVMRASDDDSSGDYSDYEPPVNPWARCIKIGIFLAVTVVAGVAIGMGVGIWTSDGDLGSGPSRKGSGSSDTSQPVCNFTDTDQPDPFLQCSCTDEIIFISEQLQNQYEDLFEVFVPINLPGFNETIFSCAPQNLALMWLAMDPSSSTGDIRVMTNRYVLALLYASWNGNLWTANGGWLLTDPECTWYGVSCMSDYSITGLQLSDNYLKGKLPSEISLLDELRVFDVSHNDIEGQIPEELYTITTLENLILLENNLDGSLSDKVGDLTNLRILWLEQNSLTGMLPESMSKLTHMIWFVVGANAFDGPVFDLMRQWPQLVAFHVDSNSFMGTIPSEIGKMSRLRTVDLSANSFVGTFPTELGNIEQMVRQERPQITWSFCVHHELSHMIYWVSLFNNRNPSL